MQRNGLPRRLVQLYVGLALYGTSAALQVRSGLGLDPWDVFHQGIAHHLHLAIGTVVDHRRRARAAGLDPAAAAAGLGTLSNVVLVGLSLDVALRGAADDARSWRLRVAYLAGGIVLVRDRHRHVHRRRASGPGRATA